jgi:elongation factor G
MKVYDATTIRNVALVGHSGSGKTQLASAILVDSGMVNRFGKVDDGTTVTDFDEEEVARKHTLSASLAYAEWNKHKINLIDTPGVGNFLSDARAALHVAEAGLVAVDAVSGVMVQTEKVWAAAEEFRLPRLVVLNRLDRERASLERSLRSLHDACSRTVIPIQLPIGQERAFKGVVDLIFRKAFIFQTDESGKFTESAIPQDMTAEVETAREALIEMVAEADEMLMEKFFEAGTLTDQELVTGLRTATASSHSSTPSSRTCRPRLNGRSRPWTRRAPTPPGRLTIRRRSRSSSGRRSPIRSRDASRCFASYPGRSSRIQRC